MEPSYIVGQPVEILTTAEFDVVYLDDGSIEQDKTVFSGEIGYVSQAAADKMYGSFYLVVFYETLPEFREFEILTYENNLGPANLLEFLCQQASWDRLASAM